MEMFAWSVFNQSTMEYVATSDERYPTREAARRELQQWLISEADGTVEESDAELIDSAAQRLNYAEYAHVGGSYDWTAETFVLTEEEEPNAQTAGSPLPVETTAAPESCWQCGSTAPGLLTGHSAGLTTCPDCGEVREEESMEYHCGEHGDTEIVSQLTVSGFTGAPIYVATLGCGCQMVDDSADNLDAAK